MTHPRQAASPPACRANARPARLSRARHVGWLLQPGALCKTVLQTRAGRANARGIRVSEAEGDEEPMRDASQRFGMLSSPPLRQLAHVNVQWLIILAQHY